MYLTVYELNLFICFYVHAYDEEILKSIVMMGAQL